MNKVEIIERDGKSFAVVPFELWEHMLDVAEDAADIAAIEEYDREDDGFRIPHSVIVAKCNGQHPVRAWREHRKLTQDSLARAAKISTAFLSQIEGGKRTGSVETLRAIAKALDVPMDVLTIEYE